MLTIKGPARGCDLLDPQRTGRKQRSLLYPRIARKLPEELQVSQPYLET